MASVSGNGSSNAIGVSAPADDARRRQLMLVRRALRGLGLQEKEIFLLHQEDGLGYEQIARSLGIPIGTVKANMRTALRKLRQAFERSL